MGLSGSPEGGTSVRRWQNGEALRVSGAVVVFYPLLSATMMQPCQWVSAENQPWMRVNGITRTFKTCFSIWYFIGSTYLSFCLPTCLSNWPSICVCLCECICMSVFLSVCLGQNENTVKRHRRENEGSLPLSFIQLLSQSSNKLSVPGCRTPSGALNWGGCPGEELSHGKWLLCNKPWCVSRSKTENGNRRRRENHNLSMDLC